MPASFVIDHARRLVLSRGWGVLTDADIAANQLGVREASGFQADYSQLYDFTDVTKLELNSDFLRHLSRNSPFAVTARRAVVVASDEAFGLARMFQLVSDRDSSVFRIFRDRDAAVEWLGVAAP